MHGGGGLPLSPRGSSSEPWLPNRTPRKNPDSPPEEDKRFGPEPASWDIDFANQRVKKEYEIHEALFF